MNPINHPIQTSPAPWKKAATLTLGLGLLSGGMSTQAATDCNAVTEISTIECESLLELYHSTNGTEWNYKKGWNVTNTPCSWRGVTCENGGVTEINLRASSDGNNLNGTLPNFRGLPNLWQLNLSNNQLTGQIPNFSALPNLKELYLYNNQLTGTIPDFSALPNLQVLSLRDNQLTGAIPYMPNLSYFSFSGNQLTLVDTNCNAVTQISQVECESLLELYHSTNGARWNNNDGWNVTNAPCTWRGVTCENGGVTEIDLGDSFPSISHDLHGTLPNFKGLPNLQRLDLYNNRLGGTIPDFSALPNLQVLSLRDNQLVGTIPDFSALPLLQELRLPDNQLVGTIPDFSALPQLQELSLYDNQLVGTIPDFSALPQLQKLSLLRNKLTGPIPDFSPLKKLGTLSIKNNPVCKDTNINYATLPIIRFFSNLPTWQDELNTFPNCPTMSILSPRNMEPLKHGMGPLEIDLEASHSDDPTTQYTWTINGQTLSGQTHSTELTEAGENTIFLTITDSEGKTATIQQNILVWKPGQAIIIAGPKQNDNLFRYTNEFTQRMYRLLKMRGYDDEKIHYLNMSGPDIEPPLDGRPEPERQDYSLFDPKKELSEAFAKAIANLTVGDQFILYLHGHAGVNKFKLLDENISATELHDFLAPIPAGVQQVIILDTCYSGSFIDDLKGVAHRVIITSTNDKSLTWQISKKSFADTFMQSLEQGMSLFESFQTAEQIILEDFYLFGGQRPWFDDDADGQFLNDGLYAKNVRVGLVRVSQAPPPEIKQVHPYITLPENEGTATLWVNTTDNEKIHQVRAILIPPHYTVKAYQGEDTDFSRIELPMQYNPVEENYGVKYDGFCAKSGSWQILYQAQDTEGVWSEMVQGEVQAAECLSATVKMQLNQSRYTTGNPLLLDMEVNGQAQADLYVAIFFPEGFFITIAYPFSISFPNTIQVYQPNVEIAGQKTYNIIDFPLPNDIAKGQYQTYGVLVTAGTDPYDQKNWIHFDNEVFEVY